MQKLPFLEEEIILLLRNGFGHILPQAKSFQVFSNVCTWDSPSCHQLISQDGAPCKRSVRFWYEHVVLMKMLLSLVLPLKIPVLLRVSVTW